MKTLANNRVTIALDERFPRILYFESGKTRILGEPKTLSAGQIGELYKIREQQGWGRSKQAITEVDPALIDVIAQVVVEILKKRDG